MSIQTEQQTLEKMIRLYCQKKHKTDTTLCDDCTALLNYAQKRLTHCPYGDNKPVCRQCTTHCYAPEMRQRVIAVMRFSGPRMLLKHPHSVLQHLARSRRT